jgi:hypothetical protein
LQTLECALELNPRRATTKLEIMECGILQQQWKIIKSITALWFCKLEHLATQHNFSGHCQSSHNLPLYSASYWTVAVMNPARRGEKDHHQWTAPRTDTNPCRRRVAHDMAKGIQISRVTSANTTHSTKILAVSCKQLSSDIMDPLFLYLWVGSVKAEPQWAKYPNLSDKSFVTSKKPILDFILLWKWLCCLFIYAHNLLSSRLPSGCARNLLPPHLPGVWWGRQGSQSVKWS